MSTYRVKAQLRNGFDVCKAIRQTSNVPIILLTVRDDEDDIVKGLNIGADDYVLKPFSPRQLVARVQTVLRRAKEGRVLTSATFSVNGIRQFDPNRHEFARGDSEPVTLTRLESRLDGSVLPQPQSGAAHRQHYRPRLGA